MSIILKKILIFCGCFILVSGVALYFYQQNRPVPEPVKIYKVPELVPKQNSPTKVSPIRAVPSDTLQTAGEKPSSETLVPSVTNTVPLEKKDDVLSEEAIQKWVTEVMEELEQLNTQFIEKYPVMIEISTMTKEEFLETYSTPESQQELIEYVQSVRPEMLAAVRDVFSRVPIEIVEDLFLEAKDHFVKMWGQEIANQAVHQIREDLGL